MRFNLVGINHRTAPLALREKAAIRPEKLGAALSSLRSFTAHGIIVSTCNRTEIYTNTETSGEASRGFLEEHLKIPFETLAKHTYELQDSEAVRHLLQVAAGLDSMVLGEYEILGQVGKALDAAEEAGMVNLALRQLFQAAVRTGRRVREETGISRNALSVSSVAIELAGGKTGNLAAGRMLVIGAGEAGKLVARAARERGVLDIAVTSRTLERAAALAEELGGVPFGLERLSEEIGKASIVVACADSPHCILGVAQVASAMAARPGQPLVIIDIAVPRNVDPAVAALPGVFLHNIDDLTMISEQNRERRAGALTMAEEIISGETAKFMDWWQTMEYRPVVTALMSKAEAIRLSHLDKTLRKMRPLSAEERESLESMTRAIVTRILYDPIQWLKVNGGEKDENLALVSELFRLEQIKK